VLSTVGLRLAEDKTMTSTSMRGSTSSASASSGRPSGDRPGVRLHLAVEEITVLDHGEGEDDRPAGSEQPTVCLASQAQRGAAGMDRLFPVSTSGMRCRRRPLPTCTSTPGNG
jgi:hypothetical protein